LVFVGAGWASNVCQSNIWVRESASVLHVEVERDLVHVEPRVRSKPSLFLTQNKNYKGLHFLFILCIIIIIIIIIIIYCFLTSKNS